MITCGTKVCRLMLLSLKSPVTGYFSFPGKVLSQECKELRTLGKQKKVNGTELIWETVNSGAEEAQNLTAGKGSCIVDKS